LGSIIKKEENIKLLDIKGHGLLDIKGQGPEIKRSKVWAWPS
jgi:hypothetical protein